MLPQGLNHVIAIGSGSYHALAICTGPLFPVITVEPADQYQLASSNVIFTAKGVGVYGVMYQWQTNGVNIPGATSASLALTNAQPPADIPSYRVVVGNEVGSIISSNSYLHFVSLPVINSQTLPTTQFVPYQSTQTMNVSASGTGQFNGFPLSYQWQLNGTNIASATATFYTFAATNSGTYSVIVSNAAGAVTASWNITVIYPGGVIGWGSNAHGQLNSSTLLTNAISIAAGKAHSIAALDNGSLTNWGAYCSGTNFVALTGIPLITNALAVAAGSCHDIALKTDGTIVAWGLSDYGQTNVPPNTTNIIAIAAGGSQSLALLNNTTVVQWGQTNGPVPAGLTNVIAIASGTNFSLALLNNSTVVAWGANDYGQANVPSGLTNVVAIAAGGSHALALRQNGSVVAWGSWTNLPPNLTNIMNIAAGENHSIAIKNDGTQLAWGDNTYGQTNMANGLSGVKLIAGGGDFSLASVFSGTVMYAVDVTKDLLLIYNTNSADSMMVFDYYLQNRPMIAGVSTLGIGCSNVETVLPDYFTNVVLTQIQNWLSINPTKRPQYVVLFYDLPSRINTNNIEGNGSNPSWPSIQYQINQYCPAGWRPFVSSINMASTNDCIGYIKKLIYIGTNYSPGKLFISASVEGYANTNYVIDDVRDVFCTRTNAVMATNGLTAAGVPNTAILYLYGCESSGAMPHLTNAVNIAGYITWGAHSSLGGDYPINGEVKWSGNSCWWIMESIESFNGQREAGGQGNFLKWFTANSFGGTNYQNTPIGGVSHTDEPNLDGINTSSKYFGLWASRKCFGICAWASRNTMNFQAVGDPFVIR